MAKSSSLRFLCVLCAFLGVGSLLAACGGGGGSSTTSTTQAAIVTHSVVVTNTVLGDFVSVVGGDRISVRVLSPTNRDPRRYALTSSDVTAIANADLVVKNGAGLEPWFDTFIGSAEHRGLVVDASVGVSTRTNEDKVIDPFVWVSPSNARVVVANIRAALAQLDPTGANEFVANERAYNAQIDGVITYARRLLDGHQQSGLAYVDEPLGYYCDEFQLKCTAVPAQPFLATAAPSLAQNAVLVNALRSANVKAIAFSKDVAGSSSGAVKSALAVKVLSGEDALGVSSLGGPKSQREDYLSLQRTIADVLSATL